MCALQYLILNQSAWKSGAAVVQCFGCAVGGWGCYACLVSIGVVSFCFVSLQPSPDRGSFLLAA